MVGGLSWGYVGPSWGYIGPSWSLCWPILRPMLAHVNPSGATKFEKCKKIGAVKKNRKTRTFWPDGGPPAGLSLTQGFECPIPQG